MLPHLPDPARLEGSPNDRPCPSRCSFRRFAIFLLGLWLGGCALAPGLYIDAGPDLFFEPEGPVDKGDYIYVPVTEQVVEELQRQIAPERRVVPPEWIQDDARYNYRVGVGDIIQVTVWDNQDSGGMLSSMGAALPNPMTTLDPSLETARLPSNLLQSAAPTIGQFRVGADGTIKYPHVGLVPIAGKTMEEVRDQITVGLQRQIKDPQVEVTVTGFRSQKVRIAGEVSKPMDLPVTDVPLHLAEAINAAGPKGQNTGQMSGNAMSLGADLDEIEINRNGRQLKVSYYDIFDHNRTEQNILLQDGDIINVPSLVDKKIYVLGEVRTQGLRPMVRGKLSLQDALQLSGGIIQESASNNKIMVFRAGPEKPIVFHIEADSPQALFLGMRFPLRKSDVLYVGPADIIRIQRVISAFMPIAQYGMMGAAAAGGF